MPRPNATIQRLLLAAATLLATVMSPLGTSQSVMAQTAIDCESLPAADSATPAATPPPEALPEAEFPESGELTVFAAASLTEAFTQIGDDIMAEHPDITITFNFAGSQTLRTQLLQGAQADVFASADTPQMQATVDTGLVEGDPRTFTRNQLTIVVPAANPANLAEPADLAQDDVRLVLAQPEVPVGRYSHQAICAMGENTATYGEGFVNDVAANIVSREEDTRAVLNKVQLGEADAGIVYASDVTTSAADAVEIIELPEESNVVASYPIAPVAPEEAALAEAFITYVLGPEGQEVLEDHGFTPLT